MKKIRIAVFASGSGSNAENIVQYFSVNESVIIDSIWTNNPNSFVLERAKRMNIKSFIFTREEFKNSDKVLNELQKREIDLIVLAGFLWLIPQNLIRQFKIVNIHPALLPKYGGKGMFGMNVHNAVVENKETETGISIHYVNEKYDDGEIIFQAKCEVKPEDTPQDVASKVHELEYHYFPKIIGQVASQML
jgi:phosphoribosylglycinamide formyltransferase-1